MHHKILSLKEIFFNQKGDKLTAVRLISKKIKVEEIRDKDSTVAQIHLISLTALNLFRV